MTFCLAWHNRATSEVSYMKGELDSYYWERGFDADVLTWPTEHDAREFATRRVTVPYSVHKVSKIKTVKDG